MTTMARRLRRPAIFVFVLLVIEFLDEVVFGLREAAWPLIRTDLGLNYEQIGLLFTIPALIAYVIEPAIGILGDVWKRRTLVIGGGFLFAISLVMTAVSGSIVPLMLSFILFSPSSGAFVALAQSTLMDIDTARHEQNMARWTLSGSVGWVVGSLLLGGAILLGLGWRAVFVFTALMTFVTVIVLLRLPFPRPAAATDEDGDPAMNFKTGVRAAFDAMRRPDVIRWLTLLEFSNLMLDILYGYLALYFVDVVGVNPGEAALAVTVWTVVGLVGDLLMIPLLERVRGLTYLRVSAVIELFLFPAFLLVPNLALKLVILGALGFFNAGWYAILQGGLYSSLPGQSGSVLAIGSVTGIIGSFIPLAIGLLAERFGLGIAIWALILGPIALLIGLPRDGRNIEAAD